MMRPLYSAAGCVITPLVALWLKRRAQRGKESLPRMGERFGHASIARPAGQLVWLHAASVGETQSVLTLVRALLTQHPALHVLITTGTVTSAALVAQQHLPRTIHQFVPVDTAPAVARFLRHWHPDLALWVESEFWPQLLWQAKSRHIPMLLINARLSAHSFRSWRKWPRTIRSILGAFTTIYAGSAEDAGRLIALGASNVRDVGNLKYDAAPLTIDNALLAELSAACDGRPLWLAASTHANEEQSIADIHRTLAPKFKRLLTIIVPRHATRGDAIARDLRERGFNLAQRSKREAISPKTEIYLADTMGELGSFYRLSDIVFIGGSLIAHGGHNPLEPARLGCALVTGAHTHNFNTIMQHLRSANAIRVVADKESLAQCIGELLTQDATRVTMAEAAQRVVETAQGASDHILEQLSQLLAGRA